MRGLLGELRQRLNEFVRDGEECWHGWYARPEFFWRCRTVLDFIQLPGAREHCGRRTGSWVVSVRVRAEQSDTVLLICLGVQQVPLPPRQCSSF